MANNYQSQDEVDFFTVIKLMRGEWKVFVVFLIMGFSCSFIIANILPDIYESEIVLSPKSSNDMNGISSLMGNYSGLASLAGINLGGEGGDLSSVAIEMLHSRKFLGEFVERNDLKVDLFAARKWDRDLNSTVYDTNIYDSKVKGWVRGKDRYRREVPSVIESGEEFAGLLSVTKDKQTGFVKLRLQSISPNFAARWLELLVGDLNNILRDRDKREALVSVGFLREQLGKTAVYEMQEIFYRLIGEQTKKIMLIESSPDYIYTVIAPPLVEEVPIKPRKELIFFVCNFLALLAFFFYVLVRTKIFTNIKGQSQ